ncbi:hypothetical protein [Micromonospora sp. NPDC002717]|uniref:hypothetical protein n=1 Tax=Micromonospora sp. NPDC002717 TaxID=3154424 RepID=UPI00332C63E3
MSVRLFLPHCPPIHVPAQYRCWHYPPEFNYRRSSMLLSFCWGWLSHPAAAE